MKALRLFQILCIVLTLSVLLAFAPIGCGEDDDDDDGDDDDTSNVVDDDDGKDEESTFAFVIPEGASQAVQIAAEDAVALLKRYPAYEAEVVTSPYSGEATVVVAIGGVTENDSIFEGDKAALPAEGYMIRSDESNSRQLIGIKGADDRGNVFGLYRLMELFGFRFFHPEQTYGPGPSRFAMVEALNIVEMPSYPRRGFHIHTMHPIEATEFLMRDKPGYLDYAKHLIDWHLRNRQNYMQFELLRTVDYDATVDHFNAIVDYAHSRGMDMGVTVTWVFQQQKAWKLIPSTKCECKEELQEALDKIMQVPWDHINLEMGSSEFTKVEDQMQVLWMDNTVEYLRENYPNTEASVKIHCSSGQTAPNYNDVNFNFLPQYADPGMGVYPHTVMFYDLTGPAPAYDNENFDFLTDWMQEILGTRKMYYYPETAYWCSMDIDVPLFLPIYAFNRWKDIAMLADWGLDGHVTFTSGHEWGYWLSDWSVARYTWDASQQWTDALNLFTEIFGDAAGDVESIIEETATLQEQTLDEGKLISYISGEDTWDEIGYIFGTSTHPKPVLFSELYRMDQTDIANHRQEIVEALSALADASVDLFNRMKDLRDDVPATSLEWFDEILDGLHTNALRAEHAYLLQDGATNRREWELDINPDGQDEADALFEAAQDVTTEAIQLMRKREAAYRYPLDLSIGWERSLTSYDFKYLYQASTGYWYYRYEKQAIFKNFNPFLDNLIDPIWFMF